ncbi:hypothetical protein B0T22DRAFT_466513 [Podospora appendiculata]|uniref:Uncharacterized protein n=1 Tax=Podospora appendiculata TaxID=314037 RepID=A0AAE0X5Q2_9PEZI|nr:hypothetical protein B0T22DRAFT_466513 [Podospora appendiculata]
MQGFHHSAPRPTRLDTSSIDFAYLPDLQAESASYDPYAHIRVPLLPDNYAGPPSFMARPAEQPDAPLAAGQIFVIAANPDTVLPAALTEVEGMGVDGVELKFAHEWDAPADTHSRELEGGMIRDMWKGLVDDVFGAKGGKPNPA